MEPLRYYFSELVDRAELADFCRVYPYPVLVQGSRSRSGDNAAALKTITGQSTAIFDPGEIKVYPVFREDGLRLYIVGRHIDSDIILTDPSVSKVHAQISEINGDYFIMDLNSTNGVSINRKRIIRGVSTPFYSGSALTLGNIELDFFLPEDFYRYLGVRKAIFERTLHRP